MPENQDNKQSTNPTNKPKISPDNKLNTSLGNKQNNNINPSNKQNIISNNKSANAFLGNNVFIGKKPTRNYVLAVITQFNQGAKTISIKARGRMISKAVDVAEIIRNKFVQEAKIKDILIATEQVENHKNPGLSLKVSSIEIVLEK